MNEEMKQQILTSCAGNEEVANQFIASIEKEEEGKTRCVYPLSDFYTYNEEVPPNVKVSSTADCEACREDCEDKHCIITDSVGKEPEKEKKCESHCPFCNSKNIDWGDCFSVTDGWYHQRATCLDCDSCFTEAMELVYKSTLLTEE